MDRWTRALVVLMTALAASVGLGASNARDGVTVVTLRPTVRLAADAPVTLGALASIEGEQRGALEGLVVSPGEVAPGRWTVVEAGLVREWIAASPARDGSVIVEGARVNLTRLGARPAPAPVVRPAPEGASRPAGSVVRDHLEVWLRARYGAEEGDLRVRFEERDAVVLGMPTEGRVVEVRAIGSSARPALRVTVYERDSIVLSETVRVGVEVRSPAPVLVRAVRRGDRVQASDFETQAVWSDPTDPPADPAAIVGRAFRRAMGPGEVVRAGQLESSAMVERGQDVSVRTVLGSVVVTTIARARHDAFEGELVELEAKDRSGRRFTARVAGPGRAVMVGTEETP